MAAFEWAQVVAFDGPELPALTVDDLLGKNPAKLRLAVQPFITLLNLHFPLDEFTLALKKRQVALRSEASNAVDDPTENEARVRIKPPPRRRTFVAVHRHENDIYFKSLEPEEYLLLASLRDGLTLAKACEAAMEKADPAVNWGEKIQKWFKHWTELGWFCLRK